MACLGLSALAQEGEDDPDFDYLPPETGFVAAIERFAIERFRTPAHPTSYTQAKRLMYDHLGYDSTLYCGCPANPRDRTFDAPGCGYVPRNDNDRARRLEAEHILPAFWIAAFHDGPTCWVADDSCGSGRECCLENDDRFRRAHDDLVNLHPVIGELNGDRSNLLFALIEDEPRVYGLCDFEVDRDADVAEPAEDVRGDIARVYFYMRDTYGLIYPDPLAGLLEDWNAADPVSEAELQRNQRIESVQGTSNPFVVPD